MEEVLNLHYHFKRMAIKALNKAETIQEAADLLGISERTLHRWKVIYGIVYDDIIDQYFIKENEPKKLHV